MSRGRRSGYTSRAMRKLASEHPSEKVGEEIRKLYSWNNETDKLINNLVDVLVHQFHKSEN